MAVQAQGGLRLRPGIARIPGPHHGALRRGIAADRSRRDLPRAQRSGQPARVRPARSTREGTDSGCGRNAGRRPAPRHHPHDRDEREAIVDARRDEERQVAAPSAARLPGGGSSDRAVVNVHDRPGPYMVGTRRYGSPDGRDPARRRSALSSLSRRRRSSRPIPRPRQRCWRRARASGRRTERDCDRQSLRGQRPVRTPAGASGATVVAVEENPEAVRDGEANARPNRVPPRRFAWSTPGWRTQLAGWGARGQAWWSSTRRGRDAGPP